MRPVLHGHANEYGRAAGMGSAAERDFLGIWHYRCLCGWETSGRRRPYVERRFHDHLQVAYERERAARAVVAG